MPKVFLFNDELLEILAKDPLRFSNYFLMSIWTGLDTSFENGIRDILSSRQQPLVLTTRVVRTWCSIALALK
jgi:hypothetical protein